jgi:hypothetical protein
VPAQVSVMTTSHVWPFNSSSTLDTSSFSSTWDSTLLLEATHGSPQSFLSDAGKVSWNKSWPLCSII